MIAFSTTGRKREQFGLIVRGSKRRKCLAVVYLSRARRKGKEETGGRNRRQFQLSTTCVSHYGREALFSLPPPPFTTTSKFCAHAWPLACRECACPPGQLSLASSDHFRSSFTGNFSRLTVRRLPPSNSRWNVITWLTAFFFPPIFLPRRFLTSCLPLG